MILNLLLIVFLLSMTGWWAKQGFFSGLLHLGLTVVAGTLALAFWEPLVLSFLMGYMPNLAWSVGLLVPFGVILLVLRILMDKWVPMNMRLVPIIDNLGGGACGLLAGVLTAGLLIVGLGFLPMGPSLAGVQPWVVNADGKVEASEMGLWVSVDEMAFGVFDRLSSGAFSTSTPLSRYQPDLPEQASLIRAGFDENASLVAVPGSVEVEQVYEQPVPMGQLPLSVADALGADFKRTDRKLVVIDTVWENKAGAPGTYDVDATARVSPTSVQLIANDKAGARLTHTYTPIAQARETRDGARLFLPFDNDRAFAFSTSRDRIGWVFLVPTDVAPQFLRVKGLRLSLPPASQWDNDPASMTLVVGTRVDEEDSQGTADSTGSTSSQSSAGNGEAAAQLTDRLPNDINKNNAQGLQYQNQAITSGQATAKKGTGALSNRTRVTQIFKPSHKGMVRLQLNRQRAQSLGGAARSSAARLGGVYLEDDRGDKWEATAYVVAKSSGDQQIHVDATNPIRAASQLPISSLRDGDVLYLYFMVDRGITITSYHVGKADEPINLHVP